MSYIIQRMPRNTSGSLSNGDGDGSKTDVKTATERFIKQNNKFARDHVFFSTFTARLRRENVYFPVLLHEDVNK